MPLHEYLCRSCDERFEAVTTIAKADEASCPACQSDDTRRLISVIAGVSGMKMPGSGSYRGNFSEVGGGSCCSGGGSCACRN